MLRGAARRGGDLCVSRMGHIWKLKEENTTTILQTVGKDKRQGI